MPQTLVKMPDGSIAQFPEGMPPDQIEAAIKAHTGGGGPSAQDQQAAIDAKAAGQTYNPQHAAAGEKAGLKPTEADAGSSPLIRSAEQFYQNSPLGPAVGAVKGVANVVAHPIDTLFGLVPLAETVRDAAKAQWDQAVQAAQKAKEAVHGATPGLSAAEAVGHGLAAVLPLIGPAAANVGQHFATGDTAGGVGGAVGLLSPFAAKYGLELKDAADATKADRLTREANDIVSQRVLAPGNPRYKPTAAAIAPEVLDRGLKGDRVALQQAAEQGMSDAGTAIDRATTAAGGKTASVPTQPIVDALTSRIQEFQINGKTLPTAEGQIANLTKLRDYIKDMGATAPLSDILKMRDEFYDTAAKAGGYAKAGGDASLGDIAWSAREAGSAIREHLANLNPDAAAARADYSFWKSLNDVLDPNLGRPKAGTPSAGVTGGRATVGAVAAQALATTPIGKAAAAVGLGKILPFIQDTVNSPAWQLAKASQKAALADALRNGQPAVAEGILYKIAALAPRSASSPAVSLAAATTPDKKRD